MIYNVSVAGTSGLKIVKIYVTDQSIAQPWPSRERKSGEAGFQHSRAARLTEPVGIGLVTDGSVAVKSCEGWRERFFRFTTIVLFFGNFCRLESKVAFHTI